MALFPNVYASATYSDPPRVMIHNQPCHHRRASSFFAHILSPASFHSLSPTRYIHHSTQAKNPHSDSMTAIEVEEDACQDGGPLCREAEIERWKTGEQEKGKKQRRMSLPIGLLRRSKSSPHWERMGNEVRAIGIDCCDLKILLWRNWVHFRPHWIARLISIEKRWGNA